jgi:hypothetical protein
VQNVAEEYCASCSRPKVGDWNRKIREIKNSIRPEARAANEGWKETEAMKKLR